MINVDFTNISNNRLIGRLLPFWIRGKHVALLLIGVLHPLVDTHTVFQKWALLKYIMAHITAQPISLEWYLDYRLHQHYVNPNDHMLITSGVEKPENIIFSDAEDEYTYIYTAPVFFDSEAQENDEMILYSDGEVYEHIDTIEIFAPDIVQRNYSYDDYFNEIMVLVKQFVTSFKHIKITIA